MLTSSRSVETATLRLLGALHEVATLSAYCEVVVLTTAAAMPKNKPPLSPNISARQKILEKRFDFGMLGEDFLERSTVWAVSESSGTFRGRFAPEILISKRSKYRDMGATQFRSINMGLTNGNEVR